MENETNPKISIFKEERGRKKKYGFLSKAHDRITELRYLKECRNAIIENSAFHEHNLDELLKRHNENPYSKLTDSERNIIKLVSEKRNEIANKMKEELEEYFKMEK